MHPYSPFTSTIRFQLMGLFTSMSLEWWNPARTSMIRPNRPSLDPGDELLRRGEVRELGAAADEHPRVVRHGLHGSSCWPPGRCRKASLP